MSSLARALETAVTAARAAAGILREEFFRPGGPRGEPGHCPADGEAEDVIRRILGEAFPGHGVVGEERPQDDRPPEDEAAHVWVIDPNDGTADFQRGVRGASVSIGLLRDGRPVLGVVLAHTAPRGGEDLFTWAEGEGPVRRNGVALPLLRDAPLAPPAVVLVSGGALGQIGAHLAVLAPGRPRPQASIAYRLALVAAGEARAALSLHHPRTLDIAGGHALLAGAGGTLLDERGEEVRHPRDGHGVVAAVFGGPPGLAAAVARRAWRLVEEAPRESPPLARPEPGRGIRDDALLRRAQGTLLGQLAGDSLGSLVELMAPAEIAARFPSGVRDLADGGVWGTIAGQPTDDSELALALGRALLAARGFDAGTVAEHYAAWHASGPFDEGTTTRAALEPAARALEARRPAGEVAAAARSAALARSKANGALMRVSPLGILAHAADEARRLAWAREDAALTHPHPTCRDASAVLVEAIAVAIRTGAGPAELADHAERFAAARALAPEIRAAVAGARHGPPDFLLDQGLVTVALQNAFFQLRHAASLEEALVDTVGRGGDTDTNAAIAGALLGAVHGSEAVPARWRAAVLSAFPLAGAPGVVNPRPPACWPVDALVLAERLAALG
jgi:ADP-ribosyl-[dinitrogen reductase] hydrolase